MPRRLTDVFCPLAESKVGLCSRKTPAWLNDLSHSGRFHIWPEDILVRGTVAEWRILNLLFFGLEHSRAALLCLELSSGIVCPFLFPAGVLWTKAFSLAQAGQPPTETPVGGFCFYASLAAPLPRCHRGKGALLKEICLSDVFYKLRKKTPWLVKIAYIMGN